MVGASSSPTPPESVNHKGNCGHSSSNSSLKKAHFANDGGDSRGLTPRSREGCSKTPAPRATISPGSVDPDVASRAAKQHVTSEGGQSVRDKRRGECDKARWEQGPRTNGGESSSKLNRAVGKKASPSSCKPVRNKKEGAGVAELFEGAASHTVDCLLYIRWYVSLGDGISEKRPTHWPHPLGSGSEECSCLPRTPILPRRNFASA